MPTKATLKIDPPLRDRLRRRKVGDDTYGDVIERLLNETYPPVPATEESIA